MSAPDDRLSRCATVLLALVETRDEACAQYEALGFAAEHLQTFRDNYGRAALGVLADHGFTSRSFEEELSARTNDRFVEMGLGATLLGALPADARVAKSYRITVGFADARGERHVLGTVELRALSRARARQLAIEAVFDERLRCSACSPRTGVAPLPQRE
ncbi:MAG: hypothetical protein SangKO_067680 [Sandaracinaceae bacterium]